MKSFNSTKCTVFSNISAFLEKCSSKTPGYGLKVKFSIAGNSYRLTELLNENGLHGMLEASGFDVVDNVFPFLDALGDAFCSLKRTAEVTSAIAEYVYMVNLMFRRRTSFEWTVGTFQVLERRISLSKKKKDFCTERTKYQDCSRRSSMHSNT